MIRDTVTILWSCGEGLDLAGLMARNAPVYDDDGDCLWTSFMTQIGLSGYEPQCIEHLIAPAPVPLRSLLAEASWAELWLDALPEQIRADAAICYFEPNHPTSPSAGTMQALGPYDFLRP